jgi:hypothetical protein
MAWTIAIGIVIAVILLYSIPFIIALIVGIAWLIGEFIKNLFK